MEHPHEAPRETLNGVLTRLRAVILAQTDAVEAEEYEREADLAEQRQVLTAALERFRRADVQPGDRALLEQVEALDQRLVAGTRAAMARAAQEMSEIRRGRGALHEYQRRGQNLIGNLGQLNLEG